MRKVLEIFGVLRDEDVDWLVSIGRKHLVPKGSTIIEAGKTIDSICIVLGGKLSVRTGPGGDHEIATLFSGEVVGEISFVDSGLPLASVVAVENSEVLIIPADSVRAKISRDEGFASRFYRAIAVFLCTRLRKTIGHFGYGSWQEDPDASEIQEDGMDRASIGASNFDQVLKRMCGN
jgi:CRP-like cAMP-binding protein